MKHRLRHPVRAIREPFGKAGLMVAVMALVFAMVGGAYAASGGLSGKEKKEVERIAKKVAGKPGLVRVGGTPTPGAPGAPGKDGAVGKEGPQGNPGSSVTNTVVAASETGKCEGHGGSEFRVGAGAPTFACNGGTGFTETLPSGKTEAGVWAGSIYEFGPVPITFVLPLSAPIGEADTKLIPEGGTPPPECENSGHPGTASVENPEAEPGFFCVYVGDLVESEVFRVLTPGGGSGAGVAGSYVILDAKPSVPGATENGHGRGTWAVTAPTSP